MKLKLVNLIVATLLSTSSFAEEGDLRFERADAVAAVNALYHVMTLTSDDEETVKMKADVEKWKQGGNRIVKMEIIPQNSTTTRYEFLIQRFGSPYSGEPKPTIGTLLSITVKQNIRVAGSRPIFVYSTAVERPR